MPLSGRPTPVNRFFSRMLSVANFISKNRFLLLDGVRARMRRVVLARTGWG